jgi:DNA modification methylase
MVAAYKSFIAGKAKLKQDAGFEIKNDESFTDEGCIVHNCPLQQDVIERACVLWSNPGETVFTQFMGIGSEVYGAVKLGRRGIGCELKPSYYSQAVKNVRSIETSDANDQLEMFADV